jgi:hypothetical protein
VKAAIAIAIGNSDDAGPNPAGELLTEDGRPGTSCAAAIKRDSRPLRIYGHPL